MKILGIMSPVKWLGVSQPIFPLGLSYVLSAAEHRGHTIQAFDTNVYPDWHKPLANLLEKEHFDLFAFSLRNLFFYHSAQFPFFAEVIKFCKNKAPGIPIVVGGAGFSLYGQQIMARLPEIDFGIFAEGETAFIDLIENNFTPSINTWYRKTNKEILFTTTKFCNPDKTFQITLPPRRDIPGLNLAHYEWTGLQTKRGCSFRCRYCAEPKFSGECVRPNNPKRISADIANLRKLGSKKVFLCDPIFNIPYQQAMEALEILQGQGIAYCSFIKMLGITPEILKRMEEVGFESIYVTIESGSDRIHQKYKTTITTKEIDSFLNMLTKNSSLRVVFSFMPGLPGETFSDLLKTILLVLKIKWLRPYYNRIGFQPFSIAPLSELAEEMSAHQSFHYDLERYQRSYPYWWYYPGIETISSLSKRFKG